ncbi:hypothetical protein DFH09DRAFT_1300820 [Mycena vulgaris]|nr:hypothetical protein DFH09DRAFT_1300820 [Mycena vulgaris]
MASPEDSETTLFLFLSTTNEWKSVCRFPLSELRKLSKRPAKWILFIAWSVYGAPGRLHLSTDPTSHEIPTNSGAPLDVDPTAPALPAEFIRKKTLDYRRYGVLQTATVALHSADAPRYIDLHILADRTSARTESKPRQKRFRQRLKRRDRRCVFSQAAPATAIRSVRPRDCEAAHIIPHSKGREASPLLPATTKLNFMFHAVPEDERLRGIDDPKNGLFLLSVLHTSAGDGECAFLLVPNPYMDVDDVYVGAANTEFPHGIPNGDDTYDEEDDDEDQVDEDDYSGSEFDSNYEPSSSRATTPTSAHVIRQTRAEEGEGEEQAGEAEAAETAGEPQDYPGTFYPAMTDDSRLILQWVGLHQNPTALYLIPHNTHATLRLGTQLTTLGLYHGYASTIINRWGRDLSDAPAHQCGKASSSQEKNEKEAKRDKDSPPFSNLNHSFLEPSIKDEYYPPQNSHQGRQGIGGSACNVAPKPGPLDWAWNVMLQFRLPPPDVAAKQEAAHRARTRQIEEASAAKAAEWVKTRTIAP